MTAWNSTMQIINSTNSHELYKKVLVALCHTFGDTTTRMQKVRDNKPIYFQLNGKHSLSTPKKTFKMDPNLRGYCKGCFEILGLKRKTSHYCVHCSENQLCWLCTSCFVSLHQNPTVINKPLYVTTKPVSQQHKSYNFNKQ